MRYFNIFSNILVTKGAVRMLISDLQRDVSELYPLELYELLEELKEHSIEDILSNYDDESREIIQEYLDLLISNEYGFITKGGWDRNFPPLSYEYRDYTTISDIFIEIDHLNPLNKIRSSIERLEVKHLVIYCRKSLSAEEFLEIDGLFKRLPLENIEIYSPFHTDIDQDFLRLLHDKTSRIYSLIFYSCQKVPFKSKDRFRFTVSFSREDLKISACGKVDFKYFNTNLPKVLEAMNHNSCLHKKIGIDIEGNIKNCPLMQESFGHINSGLEEALRKPDFKKYWSLTKDDIEVCKDCEFRYICTDCRAYTERSHMKNGLDISRPLKCGYDPYTGTWEKWSRNPLKQKAVQYYRKENHLF